jgi:hypothetical protein
MTENHDRPQAFCLWLNGPANKDRSTLASLIQQTLSHRGAEVQFLDSTQASREIGSETVFPEDLIKILAWATNLMKNKGVTVVLALKVDNPAERVQIKNEVPALFEVSLGLSQNQEDSNLVLDTGTESVPDCLARILRALELLGFIPPAENEGYSEKEAEMVAQRLKELGYI